MESLFTAVVIALFIAVATAFNTESSLVELKLDAAMVTETVALLLESSEVGWPTDMLNV